MAFYVGQKVVCVADAVQPGRLWVDGVPPKEGAIYTIASIVINGSGTQALVLVEAPRGPISHALGAYGYHAWRFRPIVERKTDISIFKAMLNPSDEQVSA